MKSKLISLRTDHLWAFSTHYMEEIHGTFLFISNEIHFTIFDTVKELLSGP